MLTLTITHEYDSDSEKAETVTDLFSSVYTVENDYKFELLPSCVNSINKIVVEIVGLTPPYPSTFLKSTDTELSFAADRKIFIQFHTGSSESSY